MSEMQTLHRLARRVHVVHFLLGLPALCVYPPVVELLGPLAGGLVGSVLALVHTRLCFSAERGVVRQVRRSRGTPDAGEPPTLRREFELARMRSPGDPFFESRVAGFWLRTGYRAAPISWIWFCLVSMVVARWK